MQLNVLKGETNIAIIKKIISYYICYYSRRKFVVIIEKLTEEREGKIFDHSCASVCRHQPLQYSCIVYKHFHQKWMFFKNL